VKDGKDVLRSRNVCMAKVAMNGSLFWPSATDEKYEAKILTAVVTIRLH